MEQEQQASDGSYFDAFVGPQLEPGEEYSATELDDLYCTGPADPEATYQAFGHYTEDGESVEEYEEEEEQEAECAEEEQNLVEITPEEQAEIDAQHGSETPGNHVEITPDERAELDRLHRGGLSVDDSYDDATKLRLEQEKKKKEDAAGTPSKEASDPKNTASGTHKTGTETDTAKHEAELKGGVHQSGASGGLDVKTEEKTETGTSHMKGGGDVKVSSNGGEMNLSVGGGSHKVDHADAEKREAKEALERYEFEKKKANGEIDKNAKFEPSEDAKQQTAPGSSTKVTSGGAWDKDKGGSGNLSVDNERTNADGTKTNIGGSAKLGYKEGEGHNGAGSLNVKHTDKDGKTIGGGASVEVDKNGVNAKVNGEYKGVGGGVEVIAKDGENGMRGDVKAGSDTVSVKVEGGKVAKFSPVSKLPNGAFTVTYTVTSNIGGGVSANTDPKAAGAKAGGGVNGSSTSQVAMTKVFATEAEAIAFRTAQNAAEPSFPTSAGDASALKPGEKVVMGDSSTFGIDASVGGQYGSVGGGHSTGKSERTSVEMLEGNAVFAERTAVMDSTGKLSYTAPGGLAGVSGSNTDTKTVRTKIKVELGTDAAPNEAGRAAYARFMEDGCVVPPAQTISTTTSNGTKKGREINLGPVKGFEISEYNDSTTHDEKGKLEESTGERQRGWELKILDAGGSYGTKLEALQRNDDDAQRAFVVTSTVKQTGAYDSITKLNDATNMGIKTSNELEGLKASGTWEAQSVMDPAGVDQFVKQVQDGKYNPQLIDNGKGQAADYTHTYFAAGDNLKKALSEAGDDKDAQRRALAKFVAEGGEDAVAQMRAMGGTGGEFFMTLKNEKGEPDPNFNGVQGRLEVESQIASLQARSESGDADPAQLLQDIKALQAKARGRVTSITPERYPDLPPNLMQQEISRSKGDLDRLEALTKPLREKVKNVRLSKLDPAERAARAKQTESEATHDLDGIEVPKSDLNSLFDLPKTDPLMMQGIMFKRLAGVKAGAEKERATARARQRIHAGVGGTHSRRPRDRIGDRSDMGAKNYADADSRVASGHMAFDGGCTQETVAHGMPETDDASINASVTCINTAITFFDQAKIHFSSAIETYDGLSTANPDEHLG